MEKIYNKLVRDKIPQIIEADNHTAVVRILDQEEFSAMLRAKLLEESQEVINAPDRDQLVGELADLKEVTDTIQRLENITDAEIEAVRAKKAEDRGGFQESIFLEKVIENQ